MTLARTPLPQIKTREDWLTEGEKADGIAVRPDETMVIIGPDLILSVRPEPVRDQRFETEMVYPVRLWSGRMTHIAMLGQLTASPDGAALAVFVDLARRIYA